MHCKLPNNAILSITRRITVFKDNDTLEPTNHIFGLVPEAPIRLTTASNVTATVCGIRIQLALHVPNSRMILGLSIFPPNTNTIPYVLRGNCAVWPIASHTGDAGIIIVAPRTRRIFKKISANPTIRFRTIREVVDPVPIITITTRLLSQNFYLVVVSNGIKRSATYCNISYTNPVPST